MKNLILAALIAVPVIAFAQEKEINLKVTPADVQAIGEGLGSLPFNKVAPLMSKLQVQINAQTEAAKDASGNPTVPATTPKK